MMVYRVGARPIIDCEHIIGAREGEVCNLQLNVCCTSYSPGLVVVVTTSSSRPCYELCCVGSGECCHQLSVRLLLLNLCNPSYKLCNVRIHIVSTRWHDPVFPSVISPANYAILCEGAAIHGKLDCDHYFAFLTNLEFFA